MLKTKFKVFLLIFIASIFVCSSCFATDILLTSYDDASVSSTTEQETTSEENILYENEASSWTNNDLYIIDDVVNVSNIVDGNAFIMANEVNISGEIGGDVFVIAQKINISGAYIYSSLFAMAQDITINGDIYDVYALCGTFNLDANGRIYRDLKLGANTVNLNGKIGRNTYLDCNNLNISKDNGTVIFGDLNYTSNSEIEISEDLVEGTINFSKSSDIENTTSAQSSTNVLDTIKGYILDLLKTLLFTFVIAILLMWLAPKFVERLSSMNTSKSFISLGVGVGSVIATIILAILGILLLITVIGAPFVLIGALLIIIIFVLGNSIASIFFGNYLLNY